ncbi:FAD-dependent thymidylate synthase [Oscillibacter sp.]|uniref:FAD-dependent thymidylate synthase n=1 Tax=Oscillibacter sp. TaxID=1945593 RepID=UPI002D7E6593|nr:FAD-dependent thymidylate synthase [Oscillibacter sp.]
MEREPHAKIISRSSYGEEVCAGAARISTTAGDAQAIFENALGNPKNRALIGKVLASGHKSLIEHAVFTIALRDVSVFVEQFFIEFRLASFTVKSRRYVDFSRLGYHIPPELEGEDLALYRRYMDGLFAAYGDLLEAGVPREDARFLLPYAFHSNFYCTLNARELGRLLCEIRYRGRDGPELLTLADELTEQLEEQFPCLLPEIQESLGDAPAGKALPLRCSSDAPVFVSRQEAGTVALLSAPAEPWKLLEAAHRVQNPGKPLDLAALSSSRRPRELEQLAYAFTVSGITLSGVTHLVRHRMQSIVVPPIQSVDHGRVILPDSVAADPAALERYQRAVREAHDRLRRIQGRPALEKYQYYFALSGNLMDVMTTMNARELQWFIRLRSCNRAQWEIRDIAVDLLRQLRRSFPELFGRFGPGCFSEGRCPEGRLACGQMREAVQRFKDLEAE